MIPPYPHERVLPQSSALQLAPLRKKTAGSSVSLIFSPPNQTKQTPPPNTEAEAPSHPFTEIVSKPLRRSERKMRWILPAANVSSLLPLPSHSRPRQLVAPLQQWLLRRIANSLVWMIRPLFWNVFTRRYILSTMMPATLYHGARKSMCACGRNQH